MKWNYSISPYFLLLRLTASVVVFTHVTCNIGESEKEGQKTHQSKDEGKPGQTIVESDSSNFKTAPPLLSVGDKRCDVTTFSEWMTFIPVKRCAAVNFLKDTFKRKEVKC